MTTADRTAGLRAARAKDSHDKRRRALAAIDALQAADTPITAAAVARAASVSTWLLYTDGVREHLDAARRRQAVQPAVRRAPPHRVTRRRSPPPACAPTSRSPEPRSAGSAPNTTSCADGSACNSVPKSTDQPAPNSSPASPTSNHSPADYSPSATPTPPKPTSHNDASANSKTTSPPPGKASAA
jgi:hypothetical protein